MHALNRHHRRRLFSHIRRQKWGPVAEYLGLEKTLELTPRVAAMPSAVRKMIGRPM